MTMLEAAESRTAANTGLDFLTGGTIIAMNIPYTRIPREETITPGRMSPQTAPRSVPRVHPAADTDLTLVPEEYRSETLRTFYAPVPFSLGVRADPASFTAPDQILYAGQTFLVIAVKDWSAFGFSKAIAVEKADA